MFEAQSPTLTANEADQITVAQAASLLGVSDRYIKMLCAKHSWTKTYSTLNGRTVTLLKRSEIVLFKEFRSITKTTVPQKTDVPTPVKLKPETTPALINKSPKTWQWITLGCFLFSLVLSILCVSLAFQISTLTKKLEIKQQHPTLLSVPGVAKKTKKGK